MTASKKILAKDLPDFLIEFYKKQKEPEDKKQFLSSYGYVLDMQENLNILLQSDDFLNFFQNGKFLDKKAINRFLFSKVKIDKEEPAKKTPSIVISPEAIKFIDGIESANAQRVKRNIQQKERDLINYLRHIDTMTAELGRLRKEYEKFKLSSFKYSTTFIEEFAKIADSGMFQEVYFDDRAFLWCVITKDCKFEYHGKDYNFGQYILTLSPASNEIKCWPYYNNYSNLGSYDMIHPHVFGDKRICYGTATAAIADNLSSFSFHNVFNLIHLILNAYNENSPTMQIYLFDRKMSAGDYLKYYWGLQPALKTFPYNSFNVKNIKMYDDLNVPDSNALVPYTINEAA